MQDRNVLVGKEGTMEMGFRTNPKRITNGKVSSWGIQKKGTWEESSRIHQTQKGPRTVLAP